VDIMTHTSISEVDAEEAPCYSENFEGVKCIIPVLPEGHVCPKPIHDAIIARGDIHVCEVCTCEHGKSHEVTECKETQTFCLSCDDGYEVDESTHTCKSVNTCTCAYGVAAEGLECPAGAEHDICVTCNDYYSLKDDRTCGSARDLICPSDLGRIPFSQVEFADEFLCGEDSECKYDCQVCDPVKISAESSEAESGRRLNDDAQDSPEPAAESSESEEESTPVKPVATEPTPLPHPMCKFPFEFDGKWYNECTTVSARMFSGGSTTAWCATERGSVGTWFWSGGYIRCEAGSECMKDVDGADPIDLPEEILDVMADAPLLTEDACEEDAECGTDHECIGSPKTCVRLEEGETTTVKPSGHAASQFSIAALFVLALSV